MDGEDRDRAFPSEFYNVLASGGWLGITTPEEYGGHGFGITEASILIEEVAKSGGGMNAASAIHLSIFGMHPVIKHGSEKLKRRTLPRIVSGDLHVCFGVTEPGAGLDTTRITTFAKREGDTYRVNGRKVWISKAQESEKVLLLTRTQKIDVTGDTADSLRLDVRDRAGADAAAACAAELGGGTLHVLVNNAGAIAAAMFPKLSEDDFRRIVEIHLMRSSPARRPRCPTFPTSGVVGLEGWASHDPFDALARFRTALSTP